MKYTVFFVLCTIAGLIYLASPKTQTSMVATTFAQGYDQNEISHQYVRHRRRSYGINGMMMNVDIDGRHDVSNREDNRHEITIKSDHDSDRESDRRPVRYLKKDRKPKPPKTDKDAKAAKTTKLTKKSPMPTSTAVPTVVVTNITTTIPTTTTMTTTSPSSPENNVSFVCGSTYTGSETTTTIVLNNDVTCTDTSTSFVGTDLTLDCNGHTITSIHTTCCQGPPILQFGNNSLSSLGPYTIRNCNIIQSGDFGRVSIQLENGIHLVENVHVSATGQKNTQLSGLGIANDEPGLKNVTILNSMFNDVGSSGIVAATNSPTDAITITAIGVTTNRNNQGFVARPLDGGSIELILDHFTSNNNNYNGFDGGYGEMSMRVRNSVFCNNNQWNVGGMYDIKMYESRGWAYFKNVTCGVQAVYPHYIGTELFCQSEHSCPIEV